MTAYALRLFVTGGTPRAEQAVRNLQALFRDVLDVEYSLEVIDVLEEPQAAEKHKVIATPTLIRELPGPPRRVVGDLGNHAEVLGALDLRMPPTKAV